MTPQSRACSRSAKSFNESARRSSPTILRRSTARSIPSAISPELMAARRARLGSCFSIATSFATICWRSLSGRISHHRAGRLPSGSAKSRAKTVATGACPTTLRAASDARSEKCGLRPSKGSALRANEPLSVVDGVVPGIDWGYGFNLNAEGHSSLAPAMLVIRPAESVTP